MKLPVDTRLSIQADAEPSCAPTSWDTLTEITATNSPKIDPTGVLSYLPSPPYLALLT